MVCLCGLVLCFLTSTILEAWLTREGLKGGCTIGGILPHMPC